MHTICRRVVLLLTLSALLFGCDGFESGTPPNDIVEERETTVQFALPGAGAVPPADSIVEIPVALVNPDGNDVSVQVLYAKPASTTGPVDVDSLPTETTVSFTDPGTADTTLVQSLEVDVSNANIAEGQKQAFFALQNLETSGSASFGSPRQFNLSVGPKPLVEAQNDGPGATVTVLGTVSRAVGAYARFQDDSGPTGASGLVVRQTFGELSGGFQDDISNEDIRPGTQILVTGTLSEFAGLLQVNGDDLSSYRIVSQGPPPAPQTVTLGTLADDGGEYISELVRVESLTFPDASGTFNNDQSYTVEGPDGNTLTFRVQGTDETNIAGTSIPSGTFTYEGVVGIFSGEIQLIPMDPGDVSSSN